MDATNGYDRKQWLRLLSLTAAHFILDMFPGLMHAILPGIQETFAFGLAGGGVLLTAFLISSNGIQVVIGHLRADQQRPFFLYLGLLLCCVIVSFLFIHPAEKVLFRLSVAGFLCGAGIGMTHPESLRAVHNLDRISSAVSSAVFMGGGVAGFAFGSWTSAWLFGRIGLFCLLPYCAAAVTMLVVLAILRIRLAVEPPALKEDLSSDPADSFWMIMAIATLSACSAQTLVWIIPQRIQELGQHLSMGGLGVSMFSLAGGIGGIWMSRFARGRREIKLTIRMLTAGIPFLIAYLILLGHAWAAGLLFVGGFFCFGSYPLMVSAARGARGPNLGQRMGLIVGGIWLTACLLPMLLGPVAKKFGTAPILFCIPVGYILSLILATIYQKTKVFASSQDL